MGCNKEGRKFTLWDSECLSTPWLAVSYRLISFYHSTFNRVPTKYTGFFSKGMTALKHFYLFSFAFFRTRGEKEKYHLKFSYIPSCKRGKLSLHL